MRAVHCSLHCLVTHIGNLLSLELPLNYSLRAASFPSHLFSTARSTRAESFLGRPARGASQLSQSLCISISSVSRTVCRSQSCDKSQLLPGLLCTTKSLPIDPLLVSAACRKKNSKIQYLQKHKVLTVVCVVWCIFSPFTKNSEDQRRL